MGRENSMTQGAAVREYLETWAAAFAEVLQQLAAPDCRATIEAEAEAARAPEEMRSGLRVPMTCSGALAGRQAISLSAEGVLALGRLQSGGGSDDARPEAASQLLRQVVGQAAARLRGPGGDEVTLSEEKEEEAGWEPTVATVIRLECGTAAPIHVLVEIDQALAHSLAERKKTGGTVQTDRAGNGRPEEGRNLDLLLDVELEASIRFGQKELLLRDVLNLRPGMVVELARQVSEPAELLVAGRLMARGEVVVVEGNYGLRITEILSPAERMAAIRG
jgi:flagellar motor switch protein FliN/FliY